MHKKILFIGLVFCFLLGSCYLFVPQDVFAKVKESIVFEYGLPISQKPEDYLNDSSLDKQYFQAKAKTENLLAGVHVVQLTYEKNSKKETFDIEVEVKDTQVPIFENFKDKLTFDYGQEIDLTKQFKAKDPVNNSYEEAIITINGNVNFKKAGDYEITVIATDKNGLTTSKKCLITILEEKKAQVSPKKAGLPQKNTNSSQISQPKPQISATKKVKISSLSLLNPVSSYDFGEYQDLAEYCYNFLITGHNSGEFKKTFPSKSELETFIETFDKNIFIVNTKTNSPITIGNNTYMFSPQKDKPINVSFGLNKENMAEYFELKEIDSWISSRIHSGMTEKEVVQSLNNFLRDKTNYDNDFYIYSFAAIGLVRNNIGVCRAYAQLFQYACSAADIPCLYVSGDANGGRHAWNKVKLNGIWYYIDTCWNACLKNNDYYLSRTLWPDHKL